MKLYIYIVIQQQIFEKLILNNIYDKQYISIYKMETVDVDREICI